MVPHGWPLRTYDEGRDAWKRGGPDERQGSEVKSWGDQNPKTETTLWGGGKGAGPESDTRKEVGSLPGPWQVLHSTSVKKVAWSAALSGISRSLSSWPRQLCSRHSTVSLAGQGPSARGAPSGSARHTLRSAPRASCCPVPRLSPDRPAPPAAPKPLLAPSSHLPVRRLLGSMLWFTQAC